jgi:hypothetical protein
MIMVLKVFKFINIPRKMVVTRGISLRITSVCMKDCIGRLSSLAVSFTQNTDLKRVIVKNEITQYYTA